MGSYSPQSLAADVRRHGVTVHRPDVNGSLAHATLGEAGTEIRLGLAGVRTIGDALAQRIVDDRVTRGDYTSAADLSWRTGVNQQQLEASAVAGAFARS